MTALVRGGQIIEGKKDSGGGGAEATSVMYASIGASSSAGTKSSGCPECTLGHEPPTLMGQVTAESADMTQ
ncbi:hypothetical protein Tco_0978035 [Tanacetum coccineum]|uniref:Uncharacterized protein n=1 Tax=Tanacetum coccineum TaxID=301880 RepID=A0ABQ5EM95_9ASTR